MPNLVLAKSGGLSRSDPRRLSLFTKTAGKDLRGPEVDEAIEWCELYGANPFTKDIYFFVFDADKPDKRRVVPVLGIGLYRKIAARSGNYRPDDKPPRFTYDPEAMGPLNPKGIVDCEVTVHRFAHGEWFPCVSRLKWEERAPIQEIWEPGEDGKRRPSGKFQLDPKKTNWRTMPETMLAKCVEADAIRKGWPNETSGSYVDGDLDASKTLELSATEIIETVETERRLAAVGGSNAILVSWEPTAALTPVPIGKFGDRVMEFIGQNTDQPSVILLWKERNKHGLNEYWARDKDGALALKKELEKVTAEAIQAAE
jgi:phage recombination protein Bet